MTTAASRAVIGRLLCCPLLALANGCGEGPTKFIGTHQVTETDDPASSTVTANTTGAETSSSASSTSGSPTPGNCEVTAIPSGVDAPDFYAKYSNALGIPVLASAVVSDAGVMAACKVALGMLALRSDVATEMVNNGARIAVMAPSERLPDLPELANISSNWNNTRGIGASVGYPLTVAAEENLLCLDGDVYSGEVILVHSFAHAMRSLGIARMEDDFDERLEALYDAALLEGKWLDAFSNESFPQYWAEGVQSWFDVNLFPPNEYHNEINTRVELQAYDPGLYSLISEYLPASNVRVDCY